MSQQTAIQSTDANSVQPAQRVSRATRQPQEHANAWSYSPAIDVLEHEHAYAIAIDVPGIRADEVVLTYERGQLRLHASVQQRCGERCRFLRHEYGVGDFHRVIPLGRIAELVDGDRLHAEYQNGVLTIYLPKLEKAQARKIQVKVV